MNNSHNKSFGNKAEDLACEYLRNLGYRVLEKNFLIRGGEIDIICKDGAVLVFVEVKARNSYKFGLPIEAINYHKLKALQKCALFYIQKIKWGENEYRFDAVTVDFSESFRSPKIEVIKNIVEG